MFQQRSIRAAVLLLMILLAWRGEAKGRSYFLIKEPVAETAFTGEFLRDARIRPENTTRDVIANFNRKMNLFTEGWIYLPGLISYNIDLEPEWESESNAVQTGETRRKNYSLKTYNLNAIFLKDKPYSLSIYSNRHNNKLQSNFAPQTVTNSEDYGGLFTLKYIIFPTTLSYNHSTINSESFFPTEEEIDTYRLDIRHERGNSSSALEYEYDDRMRIIQKSSNSIQRSNLSLRNRYSFWAEKKITANSDIRYLNITGDDSMSKTLILSESMSWIHTDHLKTNYDFLFERTNENKSFSKRENLRATLAHHLYENLITTFDLDGNFFKFKGGEEKNYETKVDFNYQRRIPWGMVHMNAGLGYKIDDKGNAATLSEVSNERHLLTNAFLNRRDVLLNSIVVTDAEGNPYLEGIDYRLRRIGSVLEVVRSPFGHIGEEEEVLIDYQFRGNPAARFSTLRRSFGVQLSLWKKLQLYYQYDRSMQNLLSGTDAGDLVQDRNQLLGMELRWRWSRTKVEWEDRDTTRIPTGRWLVQEDLAFQPIRGLLLSFSGQYGESKLKETREMDRGHSFQSNLQWHLSRSASLETEALLEQNQGVRRSGKGQKISSRFRWGFAAWEGRLELVFLRERDEIIGSLRKKTDLFFQIKRSFNP